MRLIETINDRNRFPETVNDPGIFFTMNKQISQNISLNITSIIPAGALLLGLILLNLLLIIGGSGGVWKM